MSAKEKKKQHPLAKGLYLVIRGPKSEFHKAPYHPIIVCSRQHTARWESKNTTDGHTVYWNAYPHKGHGNWFLGRYKGYEMSGNLGPSFVFFDGCVNSDLCNHQKVNELLNGAVWWSYDRMPDFVKEMGVVHVEDDFTKEWIWRDYNDLPHSRREALEGKKLSYGKPEWLLTTEDKDLISRGVLPRLR